MDKEEVLKKNQLFKNISESSLRALARICIIQRLDKKEILFLEGEKGYSFYILVEGSVRLFKSSPDGKETTIKIIGPGEMFAEVILFEEDRYPVSSMALEKSTLFMIPKHQFICLLNDERFRNDFISIIMKKMRYLAKRMQYLSGHDVEQRLFIFLEQQYGNKEKIRVSLSKKDVAAAIGTTPETLSRVLLRLKREGRLRWEGRNVIFK